MDNEQEKTLLRFEINGTKYEIKTLVHIDEIIETLLSLGSNNGFLMLKTTSGNYTIPASWLDKTTFAIIDLTLNQD